MAANQKESKNLTTLQSYNPKIIVAVSGKGRLLECLFRAQTNFQFTIAGVIASNSHCGALEIANRNQVPIFVGDYSEAALTETFKKQKIFPLSFLMLLKLLNKSKIKTRECKL